MTWTRSPASTARLRYLFWTSHRRHAGDAIRAVRPKCKWEFRLMLFTSCRSLLLSLQRNRSDCAGNRALFDNQLLRCNLADRWHSCRCLWVCLMSEPVTHYPCGHRGIPNSTGEKRKGRGERERKLAVQPVRDVEPWEQESACASPPPGSGFGGALKQKDTTPPFSPNVKEKMIKCTQNDTRNAAELKSIASVSRQRAQEKEQSYIQVSSVYERSIVLLHSNSFHRNLWSETILFGLHINATTEKKGRL